MPRGCGCSPRRAAVAVSPGPLPQPREGARAPRAPPPQAHRGPGGRGRLRADLPDLPDSASPCYLAPGFSEPAEPATGGRALSRRSVAFLTLTFFLGIVVGSVLSQAIGLFLRNGSTAHQLFVQYEEFGFGPMPINLIVFHLTLGFYVHVNLMSVIGIFLVAQLLRWFR